MVSQDSGLQKCCSETFDGKKFLSDFGISETKTKFNCINDAWLHITEIYFWQGISSKPSEESPFKNMVSIKFLSMTLLNWNNIDK